MANISEGVRELRALEAKWRDEVPPACTCPPSDETMDSHFHRGDCPRYAWNRKNFQADTATQRKCADELAALLATLEAPAAPAEAEKRGTQFGLGQVLGYIGKRFNEREPHTGAWDEQLIVVTEVIQKLLAAPAPASQPAQYMPPGEDDCTGDQDCKHSCLPAIRKGVAAGLEEAAKLVTYEDYDNAAVHIRALDPEAIARKVEA